MILQELTVSLENRTLMSNIKKTVWNHKIALTIDKKDPKLFVSVS